jgi:hypothetical protein
MILSFNRPLLTRTVFNCWPSRLGFLSLLVLLGTTLGERLV